MMNQRGYERFRSLLPSCDILIARRLWNYRSIAYSTMQYAMFLVMRDIRGKSVDQLAHPANVSTKRRRPSTDPDPPFANTDESLLDQMALGAHD